MKVCVFAASSSRVDSEYGIVASKLGEFLAKAGIEVIFGGGGIGLMGRIADETGIRRPGSRHVDPLRKNLHQKDVGGVGPTQNRPIQQI